MISNSIFSKSRFIIMLSLSIFLMGCFGDGDDPDSIAGLPKLLTGELWDARVSGVQYFIQRDPTTIRKTNSLGQFQYREFEEVTFMIGDIMLGTVTGAPVITPVDLTGSSQAVDQPAVNMMQFLQSIDSNQYPLDTITVTDEMIARAAGQSLDFNSPNFSTELVTVVGIISPGNAIVDAATAINNFYLYGYQQFGGSSAVSWVFGDSYSDGVTTVNFAPFPNFDNPVALNLNSDFEADLNPLKSNFNSISSPTFPAGWVNGRGSNDPNAPPPGVVDLHTGDYSCGGNDVFNSGVFASGSTEPNGSTVPSAVSGSNVLLVQDNFDGLACAETSNITAGISYAAQVMVQSASDHLIFMEFVFVDASGEVVSSASQSATTVQSREGLGGRVYLAPGVWTPLTIELTAPTGAVRARLFIGTIAFNEVTNTEANFNDSGPTYFDDAGIVGPDTTPVEVPLQRGELLTNASFESPDASGGDVECSEDWTCGGPASSNFTTAAGPTAQEGSQSLKQFNDNSVAFFDVPAVGGETYDASIYVQDFSGDPLRNQVRVELSFLNGSGVAINPNPADVAVIEPVGEFGNTPGDTIILVQDNWTEITLSAEAPANAVTARLLVIHSDNPLIFTGGPASAVYWDNASLDGPVDNSVLIFAEEFNAASLDGNVWNIETGIGPNPNSPGWGNDEWQVYDAASISFVNTGSEDVLRITADCPTAPNCGKRTGEITSARITTQDNFTFSTGRVEARIKVPNELSSWPAFWMLGSRISQPEGWPKAGEIDILEVFDAKNEVKGAIHFCDENIDPVDDCTNFPTGWQFIADSTTVTGNTGDVFRLYVMEWTEESIRMTVDGVEYFNEAIDPSFQEEFLGDFFLLLNIAVGGNPVTDPGSTTTWPMTMDVDYIRIYQN